MAKRKTVVIFYCAGEKLLIGLSKRDGLWKFPQGGVREGEPLREAAARELHEETSIWLTADEITLLPGSATYKHKNKYEIELFASVARGDGSPQPSNEFTSFIFASVSDVLLHDFGFRTEAYRLLLATFVQNQFKV